jgi:hypothetical protein
MTFTPRSTTSAIFEHSGVALLAGCLITGSLVSGCAGGDHAPVGLSEGSEDVALDVEAGVEDISALLAANQAGIDALQARARAEQAAELAPAQGAGPHSYEELIGEHQRLREAALSVEEERTLRGMFSNGAERLSLDGRIVQWGDMLFGADELLAQRGATGAAPDSAVDKAQICTTTLGGCLGNAGTPFAFIDADGSSDTLPFRRPDVLNTTFMVVPDAAPAFVFNALLIETSRIESLNAPGDCLTDSSFFLIRQAAFNALAQSVRDTSYSVAVSYEPGACGGALACAELPGLKTISVNGVNQSRVALGKTIFSMNSTRLTVDDVLFRSTILHELGHTMGRSHPEDDGSAGLIPGTSTQLLVTSVMCAPDASCASDSLSPDDILAIATLYSNSATRADDDCAYSAAFRIFTPL